jgi:C1A family cysteine protease
MKIYIFLTLTLLSLQLANSSLEFETTKLILQKYENAPVEELFPVYHLLHKKLYDINSLEGARRLQIFNTNLQKIRQVNSQNLSYKYGVNQFTDLTKKEFHKQMLIDRTLFAEQSQKNLREIIDFDTQADIMDKEEELSYSGRTLVNVNWISKMAPVRDQGSCGSCWAFSTAGTLEGNYNVRNAKLVSLAPQHLVDCDPNNSGCDGGLPNFAYRYIKTNGLMLESDYKYTGNKGTCAYNKLKSLVKVTGYKYCSNNQIGEISVPCTETAWYGLLAKGPVAVAVDAGSDHFQLYASGVVPMTAADCVEPNHAVIAVGFVEKTTTAPRYVIVRNSWSAYWGEKGYIRIQYDPTVSNTCFITSEAVLPLL